MNPMNQLVAILFGPILARLTAIEDAITTLNRKQDKIMVAVQLQQEALDEYAQSVSDVADEIAEDIEALKKAAQANEPLPQANVDSLTASLDKLKGLDQPDTTPVDEPHPDQTLPGDL